MKSLFTTSAGHDILTHVCTHLHPQDNIRLLRLNHAVHKYMAQILRAGGSDTSLLLRSSAQKYFICFIILILITLLIIHLLIPAKNIE